MWPPENVRSFDMILGTGGERSFCIWSLCELGSRSVEKDLWKVGISGTGGMRPSSALFPRRRAAVGLVSLLRSDIDFLRSIVGRSGDASLLRAIVAAGGGFGISSLTFGTFGTLEESFRRSRDFRFAGFELAAGDWFGVSSSPATSVLEIDRDFFLTGEGERELGREKGWVQDLRFSLSAKDEPLLSRGLVALDDVEVGVVAPLLASSTFSSAST
jgi:hypothetical protein